MALENIAPLIEIEVEAFYFPESSLFQSYGELISSAYLSFLQRLGLDKRAIRAKGAIITDSEGEDYIDCVGGYGLFNLGHNHPKVIQALIDQLNERQLFTKPFITEIPVKLAELLAKIAPGELTSSFICNSGSEAIDNAIKLARLYTGKTQIITAENSFHGYTFGALSASGIVSFKRHFEPVVPGIIHVPFGDINALEKVLSTDTAAVLLEPVQHETGVFIPPEDYLQEVQRICNQNKVVFIVDEIKTAFGKMGQMFACQHFGIDPDVLVVGKSLGGGLIPIGGLIAKRSLWKKFSLCFPMSASSFAGNVLACRVALTTVQILRESNLLDECLEKGRIFIEGFNHGCKEYPEILKRVNGIGLLIGIETKNSQIAFQLSKRMGEQGVLMMPAFGNASVLMVEPPLVISFKQIEQVLYSFNLGLRRISQSN